MRIEMQDKPYEFCAEENEECSGFTPDYLCSFEESPYPELTTSDYCYQAESPYCPQAGTVQSLATTSGNKPLSVVHVGPCFMNGGSEQQLLALAKFLNPTRAQLKQCLVLEGNHLDKKLASRMSVPVVAANAAAVRTAASQCDILLSWGIELGAILGSVRPKKATVAIAHGESKWTRDILLKSRKVIDHVVAVSQRVADRVCDGFSTTVILNGVDTTRLAMSCAKADVRARFGFSSGDFVLGVVGRLVPDKRVGLLIEAVAKLPPKFKLLIVGWGPHQTALMHLANEKIPGRYAFTCSTDYLGDVYGAMDAFCFASAHEGFGLVLAEAMLCGLPTVTVDVGCAREILHDKISGLIVERSPGAFAHAIELLSKHPAWARGIAVEGQRIAREKLLASRMAKEYEQMFERICFRSP